MIPLKNHLIPTIVGGAAIIALAACSAADGSTSQSAMDQSADTVRSAQPQSTGEPTPSDIVVPEGPRTAIPHLLAGADAMKPESAKGSAMTAGENASNQKAPNGTAASFPDPKIDVRVGGGSQVAVLSGGCFWTQEAIFEHIKGVKSVVSGYAGGSKDTATYDQVATRKTGHAETVRIAFDPSQVSYGHLLKIFFAASHDPTQVNRQGPDTGPDYRSAVFPQNAEQRKVAAAYIAQLGKAGVFSKPIATKIERGAFYPAEDRHQNFVERHPQHPYVIAWDVAKLARLRKAFPADWRNGTTS